MVNADKEGKAELKVVSVTPERMRSRRRQEMTSLQMRSLNVCGR